MGPINYPIRDMTINDMSENIVKVQISIETKRLCDIFFLHLSFEEHNYLVHEQVRDSKYSMQ